MCGLGACTRICRTRQDWQSVEEHRKGHQTCKQCQLIFPSFWEYRPVTSYKPKPKGLATFHKDQLAKVKMFASDHKRVCLGHPLTNLPDIREGMKYIDFATANEHVIKKLLQIDESSAPDDPPSAAATSSNTTAASTKGAAKSRNGTTSFSSLEGDESPDAGV
jgi:hypothetical protein